MEIKHLYYTIKWIVNPKSEFNAPILKRFYSSLNKKRGKNLKTGVVMCMDDHIKTGGLADRIRGIVTMYGYCKEKGIPFYLYYTSPMDLCHWFLPNKYNWRIEDEEMSYNSQEAKPYVLLDWRMLDTFKIVRWWATRKYKSKQLHIYCNHMPPSDNFHELFTELFRFSPMLTNRLTSLEKELFEGRPYIAISFRFNQLLGDFTDCIGEALSEEKQMSLMDKCCSEITKLRNKEFPDSKVLVTADSIKFVEYAQKKLDFTKTIPGKPVHIDFIKDEGMESYTKVFVDLLMLSKAQKVYLLVTDKMYKGNFGRYAALIGKIPFEVHNF